VRDAYELDEHGNKVRAWDRDHELSLGAEIQAGLAAAGQMSDTQASCPRDELSAAALRWLDTELAELQAVIDRGGQARYELVTANLPFAASFARQSMGLTSMPGDLSVAVAEKDYMGLLKDSGTFMPMRKMRHPGADLADRTQIAMEAMWFAAGKYGKNIETPAKFVGFARWDIQNHLMKYSLPQEDSGWYVQRTVAAQYSDAEKADYPADMPMPNNHMDDSGKKHQALSRTQMQAGREVVSLDEYSHVAPEENDEYGEATPLGIADVLRREDDVWSEVELWVVEEEIKKILDRLYPREADIVSMTHGLADGVPVTLREAGAVHSVSAAHAGRIKKTALAKLRYIIHTQPEFESLKGCGVRSEVDALPNQMLPVASTPNLKTNRVRAAGGKWRDGNNLAEQPEAELASNVVDEQPARDPQLPSWQTDSGDDWENPVRRMPPRQTR